MERDAVGLAVSCEQHPRFLRCGADLDCLGRGRAGDAVLDRCDCDEPGTGLLQANGALRGALLGFLVGGDVAGAANGSGSASFEASGRVAGGGDGVRRVGGCGEGAGDWLVDTARNLRPDDAGGCNGWKWRRAQRCWGCWCGGCDLVGRVRHDRRLIKRRLIKRRLTQARKSVGHKAETSRIR